SLKKDRDGNLTWATFYPQLRAHTGNYFRTWAQRMMRNGGKITSRSQLPHKFAASAQSALKGQRPAKPAAGAVRYVAVNIANRRKEKMSYWHRWDDEKKYRRGAVEAGKQSLHARRLASDGNAPRLIVYVAGYKKPARLQGRLHTGGKPRPTEARNYAFPAVTRRSAGEGPLTSPFPPGIGEE